MELTQKQKELFKMTKELGYSRTRNLLGRLKILKDCNYDMELVKYIIWEDAKTDDQNNKLLNKYKSLRDKIKLYDIIK